MICSSKFNKCACKDCKKKSKNRKRQKKIKKDVLFKQGIDIKRLFEEKKEIFPTTTGELYKKVETTILSKGCVCSRNIKQPCSVCKEFYIMCYRFATKGQNCFYHSLKIAVKYIPNMREALLFIEKLREPQGLFCKNCKNDSFLSEDHERVCDKCFVVQDFNRYLSGYDHQNCTGPSRHIPREREEESFWEIDEIKIKQLIIKDGKYCDDCRIGSY